MVRFLAHGPNGQQSGATASKCPAVIFSIETITSSFGNMNIDHCTKELLAPASSAVIQRRALLVDDIAYNLEWMSELLLTLGFDSTFAMSLAEAKKALSHVSFDVVFLDCELPDGFGYSLAAEIHEMELAQTPTIIGMTSSDDGEMMLRYFSAGAEGFIRKPISFDLVCESLRRCKLLDSDRTYDKPVRPKLGFNNIHFMAHGDSDRFRSYLEKIAMQLESEVTALVSACRKGEPDAARTIIHRLLSLTPLLESREFTTVLQSCQRVARWHDLQLLRNLGQAVEWEYCLVKTSLQDELDLYQQGRIPSLRKIA
jgi:CheY-like chemotaxis protein